MGSASSVRAAPDVNIATNVTTVTDAAGTTVETVTSITIVRERMARPAWQGLAGPQWLPLRRALGDPAPPPLGQVVYSFFEMESAADARRAQRTLDERTWIWVLRQRAAARAAG